jgi:hypothetical protein
MTVDSSAESAVLTTRVTLPSGEEIGIPGGGRLVFGRGPDADVRISAGRGLSRRAGLISALPVGAWVANISCTHALYAVSEGCRIRLPRMEERGEPYGGWFLRTGSVQVGSRAMLDDGQSLQVAVVDPAGRVVEPPPGMRHFRPDGDSTLLPLYLDPKTKLFLVALMWCRPWLLDPTRTTALPRTPEIARAALEATDAYHELERFDSDAAYRDRLAARVGEHLKVLRRKIADRGLVRSGMRLSDEVVVEVLIEHDIVTAADLARLNDPAWCSRQEDLWWTPRP